MGMESTGLRDVCVCVCGGVEGTWKMVRECNMTAVALELRAIYQEQ